MVNFGTAGSHTFATGTVVACRAFVQRDMDVTALGFARGTTPFDARPPRLEFPETFAHLPHGVCSSADAFETRGPEVACDVLDMEAYALAKVCWLEQARFTCVKFITDGADHAAASDWEANLPKAAASSWLSIDLSIRDGNRAAVPVDRTSVQRCFLLRAGLS